MKQFEIKDTDKCLILAPHADDESLGCGGFLLKNSKNCFVVVLTDGSKCGYINKDEIIKIRLDELKSAMEFLKIKDYKNLLIEDKKLKSNLIKLNKIKFSDYDYVFVPNEYESHIDHSCIFNKVKSILRFSPRTKIVCYEVWTPIPKPNLFLDISDVMDKKIELVSLYKSQAKFKDYAKMTTALNNFRGIKHNKEYAEAYYLYKSFLQKFLSLFSLEFCENHFYIKIFGIKIKHNF